MGATYWQSSSGDVNSAASWTNGIPATGNSPAIADGRSQKSMTINLAALAANDFELKTTPEYRGNVGMPGNPLTWLGVGAGDFHALQGSGECHLKTTTSDHFIVDSARPSTRVFLTAIDLTSLYCRSGTTVLSEETDGASRIFVVDRKAHLTLRASLAAEVAPVWTHVTGGTFVNERDYLAAVGYVALAGGKLEQIGSMENNTTYVQSGGRCNYAPATDVTASRPRISVLGGVFDIRDSQWTVDPILLVIGPDGTVLGSALQSGGELTDVDLRKQNP